MSFKTQGRLDSQVVFTLEHQYTMPWAVSLSLGDDKLFFGPKHNIYALFMILFGLFDLILLFVMWIVKQKIENKRNLFKKYHLKHKWQLKLRSWGRSPGVVVMGGDSYFKGSEVESLHIFQIICC